jgi:hypothetical protein
MWVTRLELTPMYGELIGAAIIVGGDIPVAERGGAFENTVPRIRDDAHRLELAPIFAG